MHANRALLAGCAAGGLLLVLLGATWPPGTPGADTRATAGSSSVSSWSDARALSPPGVIQAALATSGSTLYAVFLDRDRMLFRRSDDEGASWSAPRSIGPAADVPLTEALAAQGRAVHLVSVRSNRLYYRRSLDRGGTWGREVVLGTTDAGRFFRVSIDVSGRRVHVAWVMHSTTNFTTTGLYYRRSLNGGVTWQPVRRMAPQANDPGRPALAATGSAVHLAWTDARDRNPSCYSAPACPEVYYARSLDGGTRWSPPVRLTTGRGSTIGRPDIAAVGRSLVLVWQDDGDVDGEEEVYARWSSTGGKTWSPPRRLTTAPRESEHPMVSMLGRTVVVSWFDNRSGPSQVYARLSADGGRTWGEEERVTSGSGPSLTPRTGLTGRYAHVLFGADESGIAYSRRALRR